MNLARFRVELRQIIIIAAIIAAIKRLYHPPCVNLNKFAMKNIPSTVAKTTIKIPHKILLMPCLRSQNVSNIVVINIVIVMASP